MTDIILKLWVAQLFKVDLMKLAPESMMMCVYCVILSSRAIAIHHIQRTTVQYLLDVRQFNDFLGLLNENKSPLKCMENELRQ